jgi:hypothetical protein
MSLTVRRDVRLTLAVAIVVTAIRAREAGARQLALDQHLQPMRHVIEDFERLHGRDAQPLDHPQDFADLVAARGAAHLRERDVQLVEEAVAEKMSSEGALFEALADLNEARGEDGEPGDGTGVQGLLTWVGVSQSEPLRGAEWRAASPITTGLGRLPGGAARGRTRGSIGGAARLTIPMFTRKPASSLSFALLARLIDVRPSGHLSTGTARDRATLPTIRPMTVKRENGLLISACSPQRAPMVDPRAMVGVVLEGPTVDVSTRGGRATAHPRRATRTRRPWRRRVALRGRRTEGEESPGDAAWRATRAS